MSTVFFNVGKRLLSTHKAAYESCTAVTGIRSRFLSSTPRFNANIGTASAPQSTKEEDNPKGKSDKKLFTPGPLNTSFTVKEAMLTDLGSRDVTFIETILFIRSKLLEIAGVSDTEYTCVPIQGSGTFSVEAVFQTTVPRKNEKVLVLENGAYGKRMGSICQKMGINYQIESFMEHEKVSVSRVEELLSEDRTFTNIAVVHSETSSGVINPVEEIGVLIEDYSPETSYFVDAMSSFGAIPLDIQGSCIDYMVSSANKCLEGVPGFAFVIAKTKELLTCKDQSRSHSLDIFDQYEGLEKNGQFRFTPPTHTMLAFRQALTEFDAQGGLRGRTSRYQENRAILQRGMTDMGFKELLDDSHVGYIITSYLFPDHSNFDFKTFYSKLSEMDQVIYPGKMLQKDCFRIGNIGYLYPDDMRHLLECIKVVCADMKIPLPVQ